MMIYDDEMKWQLCCQRSITIDSTGLQRQRL